MDSFHLYSPWEQESQKAQNRSQATRPVPSGKAASLSIFQAKRSLPGFCFSGASGRCISDPLWEKLVHKVFCGNCIFLHMLCCGRTLLLCFLTFHFQITSYLLRDFILKHDGISAQEWPCLWEAMLPLAVKSYREEIKYTEGRV